MSDYSRRRANHGGFVLKKIPYVLKVLIKCGTGDDFDGK